MSDVRMTVDLSYPAEIVWRALTDRRLLSEWFVPTDLAPTVGGVFRAFPPPGLVALGGPFDIDVVEVIEPELLMQRWRGGQLHTTMTWELTPTRDGCRLSIVQSGFFGLDGEQRRETLIGVYHLMFQERLPNVLAELVGEADIVGEQEPPAAVVKPPPSRPPTLWRVRMLSIVGAMILTVLLASAIATLAFREPASPQAVPTTQTMPRPPGQGVQPGISGTPEMTASLNGSSATLDPVQSPVLSPVAQMNIAYRTTESFEGGYVGSITIKAGASSIDGWTAVIELPAGGSVFSAWDQISFQPDGQRWIFTPSAVHRKLGAGEEFTFFFQAGSPAGPAACSVNGVPCSGLG